MTEAGHLVKYKKHQNKLVFNYSDKFSTLLLWWKAVFLAPVWAYPVLPFVGSIIAFTGQSAVEIFYVFTIIWSLGYFFADMLKRKVTIFDDKIVQGFRERNLNQLLSIGTDYKGNDILPKRMVWTFAGGKTMAFNLTRISVEDYKKILRFIESHYPQCQIDPVLSNFINSKKIARRVLVDDHDNFIIEYRSGALWRDLRQSFFDAASPWLRFGPAIAAAASAPIWFSSIFGALNATGGNWTAQRLHEFLSRSAAELAKPVYDISGQAGRAFVDVSSTPLVAAVSTVTLAYCLYNLARITLRPNALSINAGGLSLARTAFGNTHKVSSIAWQNVRSVSLEKTPDGADKIKFDLGENARPYYIDFSGVGVNDRPRLTRALERFAPNCTIEAQLSEAMLPNRERSYTELWLQSLSAAPERNSMQALAPGQKLQNDQYLVLKRLGVGGQGTAYLCRDQLNDCDIVLKETIVPAYADRALREQALKNFEKEAKILDGLDCDNIVRLKDFFFEDHRGYIGLEHIKGQNLRQLIENEGAMSPERVHDLIGQMVTILEYLHERSIIHRDFTPDNLMLTGDNQLKLIDFNVAQVQQVGTTGTIAGKHAYLPPEQFRGKASTQSDLYAMGGTVYFLLTGKDPEPITQSNLQDAGLSAGEKLEKLVTGCTALDVAKRYQTIAAIAADYNTDPGITIKIKDKVAETEIIEA